MSILTVFRRTCNLYLVLCTFYNIVKAPRTFYESSNNRSMQNAVYYVIGCSAIIGIAFVSVLTKTPSDIIHIIIDNRQFAIDGFINSVIFSVLLIVFLKSYKVNATYISIINTGMYILGTSAILLSVLFPFCLKSYVEFKIFGHAISHYVSCIIYFDLLVIIALMVYSIKVAFTISFARSTIISVSIFVITGMIRSTFHLIANIF